MKFFSCCLFAISSIIIITNSGYSLDLPQTYGRPLPAAVADEIKSEVRRAGAPGVSVDINVPVHVPLSENKYIPPAEINDNLWATIVRPSASPEKLPTVLIPSGYTRMFAVLAALLVPKGYNFMVIDVRGAGSSGGEWAAFDLVEQYDIKYVIDRWIPAQPWSDGKVALYGMSAMAIGSVLASGLVDRDEKTGEPAHLKAALPMSFFSDAYGDIAFQGGNVNIEIFSTWVTLTSLLSVLPPFLFLGDDALRPSVDDINEAMDIWMTHIRQVPRYLGWMMDYNHAVFTDFWKKKSSMIYWPVKPKEGWGFHEGDNIEFPSKLPFFTMTGWFDLFNRGVLNHYQYGLSQHSDSDKAMIIGEWGHVGAISGFGVPALELLKFHVRWLDWKVKRKDDCFMKDFPVIMRVMGEKRWRAEKSWPLPESRVSRKTLYLSKRKAGKIPGDFFTNDSDNRLYSLVTKPTFYDYYGTSPELRHWIMPEALHGLRSKSSQRWLYGGLLAVSEAAKFWFGNDIDDQVFWEDERADDWKIPTFTSEKLSKDLEIVGPLLLKFWASTDFTYPATQSSINLVAEAVEAMVGVDSNLIIDMMNRKDVQFVVELDDVFPDGRARNITSGWLLASHRQYDPSESARTDEHALDPDYTPFDPFYNRPDVTPKMIEEGDLYEYAVELLPTCNVFKAGHRIRLTITGSDVPHFLPVLRPSTNKIVIDNNHPATLEYSEGNRRNEGVTWKWIGPAGDIIDNTFNNYLLYDKDEPDAVPLPQSVMEEIPVIDNPGPADNGTQKMDDEDYAPDSSGLNDDPGNSDGGSTGNSGDNSDTPAAGCGSFANAAVGNHPGRLLPDFISILVLMLFPFSLVAIHRMAMRK